MENIYKLRFIPTLLLLIITSAAFAQIPNPSFETWSSGSCDLGIYSYNNPNGWGTINSLTCPGGGFTCLKATGSDVFSGNAALELTTVSIFGQTAPGICATGSINQNTQAVQGGFALSTINHPDKLIGWYKYTPSPPDTFSISIDVFSGATTGTIIGSGSISGTQTVSTYTKFIVNIPYTAGGNGDSAQITIINSAGANGQAGTTMYVDSLGLISCAGFNATPTVVNSTCTTATGSITLGTPVNGTAPYTYGWSNSSTTSSVSNLVPGSYKVTITDANTCQVVDTIVVAPSNVSFAVNDTGSTTSCASNTGTATVSPSGGNSPYSYLWANNSTTSGLTGLGAGNYNVTVTDAHGCTASATVPVVTPNGPSATDTVSNVGCFGQSTGAINVTVTGGASPINYVWSNGATTTNLTDLSAGPYTLTITDHNGCSFTVAANVNQPAALSATVFNVVITCYGDTTSVGTTGAQGGTPPYTYVWNTGDSTSFISGIHAGIYTLVITDSNSCAISLSDTIQQPAVVAVTLTPIPASTASSSNGSDIAVATGGTGVLTLAWSTGANFDTISHLSPGTYCVTVTDANNCSVSACDSVGYSVGINTIPSALFNIYPNPASSQLTIEINSTDGKFLFNLYSLDGRLVEQNTLTGEKSTLELNRFADGFYTYQIKDEVSGAINYGKLEIQR